MSEPALPTRTAYVVTGGAGLLGQHLVWALAASGALVYVVDDLSTGYRGSVDEERTPLLIADVADPVWVESVLRRSIHDDAEIAGVFHLASPASPPAYQARPTACLRTNAHGVENAVTLALAANARLVIASTSEVYGDPTEHPQSESYRGNVDPVGPRSMYDEGKRYAEAYVAAAVTDFQLNVGIARIFNTYGPGMDPRDGRMIPNFVRQALAGEPLTIHGDGAQTRTLCYVEDTVRGLCSLMAAGRQVFGPVNIGGTEEQTVQEIAALVGTLVHGDSPAGWGNWETLPRPEQDPELRKPDISRALALLNWAPSISIEDGLRRTIEAAREDYPIREHEHELSAYLTT